MPLTRDAVLHLPSRGGVEAALVRDLVAAVHDAYSGLVAFERIFSSTWWYGEFLPPRRTPSAPFWFPNWELPIVADSFVFPAELLLVTRVELGSPGFWEFLGALNPLEVIRKYLDDRHRRRQDRAYREREEERRLGLENDLTQIKVIRETLELARENGVPDSTLAALLQKLISQPLGTLGALQDRGVIDGSSAEVRELPPGERGGGEQTDHDQ
jgi:hypothetical protein